MEERTAESEHIIATLVSNLDPQPSKDDAQRVVCNGSDEELQLQLAEVRMYVHAYIRTQGEGRGPVWWGCGRVVCIHTHTVHTYVRIVTNSIAVSSSCVMHVIIVSLCELPLFL